jgi:hypothetical protein
MSRKIENQILLSMPPASETELLQLLRPNGPTEDLKYGYLGRDEDLDKTKCEDSVTMSKLGITYEQMARTIEDMFLHMPRTISDHRLLGWEYIHSPVCPWGDFCAVSPFDYSFKITELWLCRRKFYWRLRAFLFITRNPDALFSDTLWHRIGSWFSLIFIRTF